MSGLTGVKDVDLKILQELTDKELSIVCSVNKKVAELCNDENFWMNRLRLKIPFPDNNMENINDLRESNNKNIKQLSYKELYKYLFGKNSKNNKDALFKSIQLDNVNLFKKLKSLYEGKEIIRNYHIMKEAGKYSSYNIITYLLLSETTHGGKKNLASMALYFENDKVFKWLKSMDVVDYNNYIETLIEKLNEEDIDLTQYEKETIPKIEKCFSELSDLEVEGLFSFISVRLNDENLNILIKLYDIISEDWKDEFGEENIIPWIDEGLEISSASEDVKNKFRDHVKKSFI